MSDTSSSSNDEAEKSRFAKAVDPNFDGKPAKIKETNDRCSTSGQQNGSWDATAGTDGFQRFAAKRLNEILDRTLIAVENDVSQVSRIPSDTGIRLFASSKTLCTLPEEPTCHKPKKRKRKRQQSTSGDEEDPEDLKKFASVAVTSEWVLQRGKGVYDNVSSSQHRGSDSNSTLDGVSKTKESEENSHSEDKPRKKKHRLKHQS